MNSYFVGSDENVEYNGYRSYIEVFSVISMEEFDFNLIGLKASLWDLDQIPPTLKALDNTPVYTAE